jgi:hypothetical protein
MSGPGCRRRPEAKFVTEFQEAAPIPNQCDCSGASPVVAIREFVRPHRFDAIHLVRDRT